MDQHVQPRRRRLEQLVPAIARDRSAMGEEPDQFPVARRPAVLAFRCLGPDVELVNAQHLSSPCPISGMGQTALRHPALSGLDIDLDLCGEVVQAQTRALDRSSESLVRHAGLPSSPGPRDV